MNPQRRPASTTGLLPLPPAFPAPSPVRPSEWKAFCRTVERKRRALVSQQGGGRHPPRSYLVHVTAVSFRLDGIPLAEREAADTLARSRAGRAFRSRQGQRLRNHVAILYHIGHAARGGRPLTAAAVVRWYTSISCGLSSAELDAPSRTRLDHVVRQLNAPAANLRSVVEGSVRLYDDLLRQPIFPGFNGILARLLLASYFARSGLPPPLFDVTVSPPSQTDSTGHLRQFLKLIPSSYDRLLGRE